jgi:adenosylcobinamide-phosphate synthase
MEFFSAWYTLPVAFAMDMILGDPRALPHPIRWMGKTIETGEPYFRKLPVNLVFSGTFFAILLIGLTWAGTVICIKIAAQFHSIFGTGIEIILIYYCLSARSLEDAAMGVSQSLNHEGLQEARAKVAKIVGRDVEMYDKDGIARAAVETVAENLVDGVISPLFFAAIGGAPLAMAYKMVNTLDSMVGYKNENYIYFGKSSARIDDMVNFIPARLAIPIVALAARILSGKGLRALKTAMAEGNNHASPNAGYPEAAFAGVLGVKLNGPNYYGGRLVDKPYIGLHYGKTQPKHIKQACDLMLLSSLLWLVTMSCATILLRNFLS